MPAIVGALMAIGLASCGGATAVHSMPCPRIDLIPDASYVTKFAGDSEDLTDTAYEAKIAVSNQICHYLVDTDTKKTRIRSNLQITVTASRGPKLGGDKADIAYRISVTGRGQSHVGEPGWANNFTVTVPMTANKPTNGVVDETQIFIPLAKDENGDFYEIHVGLVMTEKEVAYNRRNPQQ